MIKTKYGNLTGMVFNRLTVVRRVRKERPSLRRPYYSWECLCECGQTTYVSSGYLVGGRAFSCGCIFPGDRSINRAGSVVGRLTVISEVKRKAGKSKGRHRAWMCKCECGKEVQVRDANLRLNKTRSCGCLRKEFLADPIKYGGNVWSRPVIEGGPPRSYMPEYYAWRSMLKRCNNPADRVYKHYGGRGIKVCDEWVASFDNFFLSMGERPSSIHSLDRIDVNGDYCPANCRWATPVQQCRNRTTTRYIIFNEEKMSLPDWADKFGLPVRRLGQMVRRMGDQRAIERAILLAGGR